MLVIGGLDGFRRDRVVERSFRQDRPGAGRDPQVAEAALEDVVWSMQLGILAGLGHHFSRSARVSRNARADPAAPAAIPGPRSSAAKARSASVILHAANRRNHRSRRNLGALGMARKAAPGQSARQPTRSRHLTHASRGQMNARRNTEHHHIGLPESALPPRRDGGGLADFAGVDKPKPRSYMSQRFARSAAGRGPLHCRTFTPPQRPRHQDQGHAIPWFCCNLAKAIFGSANDRQVKRYQPKVDAINALEPEMAKLSDSQLQAKTAEFRAMLANGIKLDDLLVPAFAIVREACKRVLGMRHFDVQLIGGMVLNERAIAEMRTGEGKTLVATLAGLSQRARRQGRPRGHRQRLPRPPRRRLDGPDLQFPRPDRSASSCTA